METGLYTVTTQTAGLRNISKDHLFSLGRPNTNVGYVTNLAVVDNLRALS